MAGFTAHGQSITDLGGLVGAVGGELSSLVQRTGMDAGYHGGLLGPLEPAKPIYEQLCRDAIDGTGKAGELGTASGEALANVGALYLATDEEKAADVDSAYPEHGRPERIGKDDAVVRADGGKPFTKVNEDPTGTAMRDYRRGPNMERPGSEEFDELYGTKIVEVVDDIFGRASFVSEVQGLLNQLAGKDVIGELMKVVAPGNWELLDVQAVAFQQAALAMRGIRQNLDQGRYEIQPHWQGNAANEALLWLQTYSRRLEQHERFLSAAAYEIMAFCRTMYLNMLELSRCVDLLIGSLTAGIPFRADLGAALKELTQGANALEVAASIVGNLLRVGDAVFVVQEGILLFHSMANRAAVEAVPATEWPAQPYTVPKGMGRKR